MKNVVVDNAAELWQKETSLPSIPSFSQSLDNILGYGGIQLGSVTELLGLPGTGKTQLCLQLCASVQIPEMLGGLDAQALYVDTNTNFTLSRYKEILNASLLKCQRLVGSRDDLKETEALKKLHYVKTFGLEKFCAFMYRLHKFVADNPKVKLIVIDSIVFPFKEGIAAKQRTGLLFRLMADLQRIAIDQHIAVVLTNEMSTRLGLSTGSMVGSLGDAWSHRCNKRLLLSAPDGMPRRRVAVLLKSNDAPSGVTEFQYLAISLKHLKLENSLLLLYYVLMDNMESCQELRAFLVIANIVEDMPGIVRRKITGVVKDFIPTDYKNN